MDAFGVRIAVHEWGAPDARPLLLAHGGFDFARTFDVFAPLLADAGWRVVSWDHRGHGDSEHAALHSWPADVRDALCVLDATTNGPVAIVGHSKGGGLMTDVAHLRPQQVSHLVNLEGLPSSRPAPDVAEHERLDLRLDHVRAWLDHRRHCAEAIRKPGTPEDLARRRGRMNPRLSREWLLYLVSVGAAEHPDGWRWKIDPTLRFGGFGPWRPEWALEPMRSLRTPFLGVIGLVPEEMGWGSDPEKVRPNLPPGGRLEAVRDAGHFVHIEYPDAIAGLVLEFLGKGV